MSELMTVVNLPGVFGAGYMDWGRMTRTEIIKKTREYAAHQKEVAEAILNAKDEDFVCRVVRGLQVRHLVEELKP